MDKLFNALNDSTRRKILSLLQESDLTVSEIGVHFPITGASLSHHLSILKSAGLIISQREGKYIKYSLNVSVFEDVLSKIINIFSNKNK